MPHLRFIIGRRFINRMIRRMLIVRNAYIKDPEYICIPSRVKVKIKRFS